MFLKIDKVGCIENAQIDLSGLNIITGPNESGKSTVGKTAYTVIKAIQNGNAIFEKNLERSISDTCRNVFFDIQQHIKVQEKTELQILEDFFEKGVLEIHLLSFLKNKNIAEMQKLIDSRISSLNKGMIVPFSTNETITPGFDVLLSNDDTTTLVSITA